MQRRENEPTIRRLALSRRLVRNRAALGLLALFSGVAVLLNIIGQIDLRVGLLTTALVAGTGMVLVVRRASLLERRRILRAIAIGAVAGFIATLAYDVSRTFLSILDPSPFNPFHVIRVFGTLIAGEAAGEATIVVTGAAVHLLNGTTFGIAYALLFAGEGANPLRRALGTGVAWGVSLELFQLTLYPGWLDIRTYAEFATISALAHVVYGATLGGIARSLLRRSRVASAEQEGASHG